MKHPNLNQLAPTMLAGPVEADWPYIFEGVENPVYEETRRAASAGSTGPEDTAICDPLRLGVRS
jgi:hypothetical protein